MAFTADEIRQEAQTFIDGAGKSRSAYLHMLDGIAKFHKYPLSQQATLSYASDHFSAVAEARIWDKVFHVRVKKGADGIALADEKSPIAIKTVYDVSETEGWPDGKQPDLLWHFDAERDKGVFQGLTGEKASVMDGLLQTCWDVADVFVADYEKTGDETLLLSASVGYVLMKRLGFSREAEIHAEQTITEELLHSAKTIPLQEISDISREILNGIQDYVQKGKGRGEDFPLLNVMYRLRENYAGHEEEIQEEKKWREASQSSVEIAERQEISSVEAPAPEAADATKKASEPQEAGASPEPPAQMAATDDSSPVAAMVAKEDMYFYHPESESFWMLKVGEEIPRGIDFELSDRISKEEYEAEKLNSVRSWQEISSVEAPVPEAADATKEAAEPKEAGASPESPAQMAATDDSSSVAAMDDSPENTGKTVEPGIKFHGGRKGDAFQRNISAILTMKALEENPAASMSSEMRELLLGYSGFGNLPEVFDPKNKSWTPEHDLLKKVLTQEEYAAARASVLNSYYTDPAIVSVIYQGLAGMGFKKGNILEPSCGVGNFFRAMPEDIRKNSHLFGVELDSISGRIARQLHPDANISIQGFETSNYPEGSFDLAITNVPFENYKIHGFSVHDYFLLKMAQQVRPGGLMVAITSRYSMDKKDSSAREELARRADLVKAIRLPNTAFRDSGAEATTDILILRRREHNLEYGDALPSWVNVVSFEDNPDIYVNPYFLQHPEDVIGSLEKKSTSYGFDLTCKPVEGKRETGEIASEIAKAMSSIRAEYVPAKNELPIPEQKQDGNAMAYSFFVDGEQVQFRDTDSYHVKSMADLGIDEKDKQQLLHLIRLRDLTREVIRVQQSGEGDEALVAAQEHMNAVYDDYAEAYGDLHAKEAKQLFEADCSYPLLLSLEQTDEKGNVIGKSDIFTKRTIRPHVPPSHVDTAQEALIVS
ncbi:MAG: hypothetical protein J6N99_10235, partial [Schwartzia sp.]|nr:hypothetical protein [Schwartzia sp. (in: firmicutes)]